MLFSDSCIVNELPVLSAARLDGGLTVVDPPSPDGDPVRLVLCLLADSQSGGLTRRTDSSSTVAAVPGPPADGGGAEAADPGRNFSAQQPPSHQGQKPLCTSQTNSPHDERHEAPELNFPYKCKLKDIQGTESSKYGLKLQVISV